MPNNKILKDGLGVDFTTKTTEAAGVNVPHVNVDTLPITQPLTDAQLRANLVPVIPSMASGGNLSLTTNATGTTFNVFASQACKQLNVSNQTGVTIEVQQGGTGVAFQIPTNTFYTFFGITNTNQLGIRRTDTLNTQVTVTARWEL